MTWAVFLLQDTETLKTYEEYAKESAYEADGEKPLPHQRLYPPAPTPRNPTPSPEENPSATPRPTRDLRGSHRYGSGPEPPGTGNLSKHTL